MKKILTIFGTRPEAIKMSILVHELDKIEQIDHRVCVTAQHREMLDQVLLFFNITPYYDLDLMQPGQDLSELSSRLLTELKPVLNEFKPDLVLVHGDTSTSMISTLSSFYHRIPVGHIEAGLRTGNIHSPFPEEANRLINGRLAAWHFAPTQRNVSNLISEGTSIDSIFLTGNTVIDSLLYASNRVNNFTSKSLDQIFNRILANNGKILLITGHRRENFGQGFTEICDALAELARTYPNLHLVYPVHLNPNVQQPVYQRLGEVSNIHLIDPLAYPDFVYAMKLSWAILTDSGGVQEEAPGLGKPVLVMRDTTERPEAVEAGTVKLVGANREEIIRGVVQLLESPELYKQMSTAHNPYGDGKAVSRIVSILKEKFNIT